MRLLVPGLTEEALGAYVRDFDAVASTLRGSGLEVRAVDPAELRLELAIDAMALSGRVDSIVVLPGSTGLEPLERGLSGSGVRLETAGFDSDRPAGWPHLELGAESLFQP